jgi:hypothetical protein
MNFIPQNFWDCKGSEMFWNRKIILKKFFKCTQGAYQPAIEACVGSFKDTKIPQKSMQ